MPNLYSNLNVWIADDRATFTWRLAGVQEPYRIEVSPGSGTQGGYVVRDDFELQDAWFPGFDEAVTRAWTVIAQAIGRSADLRLCESVPGEAAAGEPVARRIPASLPRAG
ncbi:MAG: hypothetical protein IT307_01535 [Chloroflexi bacterium]|nr:hypothetical protein [Chloroflexota bacterium]